MSDWRVRYKLDFLETLINQKRRDKGRYDYIKPEQLSRMVQRKVKSTGADKLTAINALIEDVREGKIL